MTGLLASPSIATMLTPSGAGGEACSLARSDSASSCCSTRSAPELLLGLQYNSTTGHLSVEVRHTPIINIYILRGDCRLVFLSEVIPESKTNPSSKF